MRNDFRYLKRKTLSRVLFFSLIAILLGLLIKYILIDGVLQDPFARWSISVFQKVLRLDRPTAISIYNELFRQNKAYLMMAGLFLLLLSAFYYTLSRYTKYFNEISTGLDAVVEDTGQIELSPEMEFMQNKLTAARSILRKRQEQARQEEQRKNDLVVYLAHDIKTPLTSVIGYLSLLSEIKDMPEEQRNKYLSITLEKANRLETLINEFFEITRFNLQTIPLEKQHINLSFMLLQMADEFHPLLSRQNRSIRVDVPENLMLFGDPDKLARVFNNILKNAVAYSLENTEITVQAKKKENTVEIQFQNHGVMIPPEKLDSIFEKFYRLDSARSTNTGGAGLGLAIAKEIVAAHGGTIRAQSDPDYTTFTISLPAAAPPQASGGSAL